jgi:hypothetical protein
MFVPSENVINRYRIENFVTASQRAAVSHLGYVLEKLGTESGSAGDTELGSPGRSTLRGE